MINYYKLNQNFSKKNIFKFKYVFQKQKECQDQDFDKMKFEFENYKNMLFNDDLYDTLLRMCEILDIFPDLSLLLVSKDILVRLFDLLEKSIFKGFVLKFLCYLFQIIEVDESFFNIIIPSSRFFSIYEGLLIPNSQDSETIFYTIFSISYFIKNSSNEINQMHEHFLQKINQWIHHDDRIDYAIIYLYSTLSKFSYNDNTIQFFQFCSPIIFDLCHNENQMTIYYSFKALYRLGLHSPLPFYFIVENNLFDYITQCLHSNNPKLQIQCLELIRSCVQFIDFPINQIFECNIIERILYVLKSYNNEYDQKLAEQCMSIIRLLIQNPTDDCITNTINAISSFNFLQFFNDQPYKIKIKGVDIFDLILHHSTQSQIQQLFSNISIDYLCDLITLGDPLLIQQITLLLTASLPTCKDYISQVLTESGAIYDLIAFSAENPNPSISTFLESIKSK